MRSGLTRPPVPFVSFWPGPENVGRREVTDNAEYGALVAQATLIGVFLTGAGWVLLGAVLVFGGRGEGRSRTSA